MIFEHKFRTGFRDVGITGLTTNKSIQSNMVDAAGFHSELAGFGVTAMPETKLTWVMLEWKLEVMRRPVYGEEVLIQTWTKSPKKFFSIRDYKYVDKDGNILAKATSKWVLIDLTIDSMKHIPEELIATYGPEDDINLFEEDFDKQRDLEEYDIVKCFEVSKSDIDINRHVNNTNFIDFAYDIIPLEEFKNTEFNSVRITYKHEIKYGETVKAFYKKIDDKNVVVLKTEDEKEIHAIITLK